MWYNKGVFATRKCWIGLEGEGEQWLQDIAIYNARHVNVPKWLSWRFLQVESINRT